MLLVEGILPASPASLHMTWRAQTRPMLAALDPTLDRLLDSASEPSRARRVSADFLALHGEMTMVSASGLGERW